MAGHVEHAPSASERWLNCPGSVAASRGLPDQVSAYAEEGTRAHEIASQALVGNLDQAAVLALCENDAETADYIWTYVDYCRGLMTDPRVGWRVEVPLTLDKLSPPEECRGTCDFLAYDADIKLLTVIDLKFGRGVTVEAVGNTQLRTYGLMALLAMGEVPISQVRLVIVQPRVQSGSWLKSETLDAFDLYEWGQDLKVGIARTLEPGAPLIPGEWCRWCRARATCPALRQFALSTAQDEFATAPRAPTALTPEQVGEVLRRAEVVELWLSGVREHAFNLLNNGIPVPGWKLVEKRAKREWFDPLQAAADLRHSLGNPDLLFHPPELKSPAQVEQAIGKKAFKTFGYLVTKKSTGLTMARDDDDRAEIPGHSARDEFAALPPVS